MCGLELSGLTAQRKQVRQMSKKDEAFRRYEKLAKAAKREKLESASDHKPGSCAHCLYYRPDFKYRRCQFTRCPYGKDMTQTSLAPSVLRKSARRA